MYKIITINSTFTAPKNTVMLTFTGDKTPEGLIQARKVLHKMASSIANDIVLVLDGKLIATIKHHFVGSLWLYYCGRGQGGLATCLVPIGHHPGWCPSSINISEDNDDRL